jgi:hypothetical protein
MSQPDDEGTRRAPRDDNRDAVSGPRRQGRQDEPDVLLEIANLRVDEISLEVEDLTARVSLQANVLDLLNLHVGVDAALGAVQLTIKGVEADVLLKARLDNVARIIDRVLTTIDNNPAIVGQLTEPVGQAVTEVGGAVVDDIVTGAGSAIVEVGEPERAPSARSGRAPQIVEDLGQGIANEDADLAEDAFPQPPAKSGDQQGVPARGWSLRPHSHLPRSRDPESVPVRGRTLQLRVARGRAHAGLMTAGPRRADAPRR